MPPPEQRGPAAPEVAIREARAAAGPWPWGSAPLAGKARRKSPSGAEWAEGCCRPRRRSVARRQGGPLAGAAPGRGAGRGRSGWGMGGDGSRGAADSPRVRRARQTRRRGAGPLRCCSQRAGAGAGSARPLCRAAAAGGGGRAGGGAPRGACPGGRAHEGVGSVGAWPGCWAGPGVWTREAVLRARLPPPAAAGVPSGLAS